MRKRIEVTKEDIAKGKRLQPESCPIARAMTRTLGRDVCVGAETWRWYDERKVAELYRELPLSAVVFRQRFDSELSVEPFHFFVNVP